MKESKIQTESVALLAANGYLCHLIEYRGRRNAPDCMVHALNRPTQVAYLELKTKRGKRSAGQVNEAELYKIWGHEIGVPRTAAEALAHVKKVFNETNTQTAETSQRVFQDSSRPAMVVRCRNPTSA